MRRKLKKLALIVVLSLLPTLLIWSPFVFKLKAFWNIPLPQQGMATIVANYDGPLYLVVAKTLYNQELIKGMTNFPLPTEYYAAHFPLFPLLIKALSFLFGYPYGMLLATLLSSILALYFFNRFIGRYLKKKEALFATLVFSLFPARWLVVRSVGSAEPLFLAAIIASVYYFQKKKYLPAGLWGAVAQLTKSPGILLFFGFLGYVVFKETKKLALKEISKSIKGLEIARILSLLLIPLSLAAVFYFYKIRLHDFWAYFHSGDNIHLFFPPFQIFNYAAPWVGTFWLEEIIFVYLIGAIGILKLIENKERILAWVCSVFFLSTLFVAHRDIVRYSLPLVPFLFAAFSDLLTKKEFKIAFVVIVIPIFLFSLAFISQNAMPISDWGPFL